MNLPACDRIYYKRDGNNTVASAEIKSKLSMVSKALNISPKVDFACQKFALKVEVGCRRGWAWDRDYSGKQIGGMFADDF